MDEMVCEASLSEEKCKKAMVDAARLADELRNEQELAQCYEKDRKIFECQVKELQVKLDESESNALKGGKKAMNKMETRIRELESEVDAEHRRMADSLKSLRKSERRIKEMTYAADEDRKNHERMQALVDQLQAKIKSYSYLSIKHACMLNYLGLFFHPICLIDFSIYVSVPFCMCIPCMLNRYTRLLDR